MYNTGLIKFKKFADEYGELVPIEECTDIPFSIKRVYYISNVISGRSRGYHAHKKLHQILICVKGSVKIKLDNGKEKDEVILTKNDIGLYIGPYIWHEMHDFSDDCVLLVFASDNYDEEDYIRDYEGYLEVVKERF